MCLLIHIGRSREKNTRLRRIASRSFAYHRSREGLKYTRAYVIPTHYTAHGIPMHFNDSPRSLCGWMPGAIDNLREAWVLARKQKVTRNMHPAGMHPRGVFISHSVICECRRTFSGMHLIYMMGMKTRWGNANIYRRVSHAAIEKKIPFHPRPVSDYMSVSYKQILFITACHSCKMSRMDIDIWENNAWRRTTRGQIVTWQISEKEDI